MTGEDDQVEAAPEVATKQTASARIGILRVFEIGLLGVAFAIVYSFGILRFSQMVAMEWGRIPALLLAACSVGVAVAFINSVSRLMRDAGDQRYTKDVDAS